MIADANLCHGVSDRPVGNRTQANRAAARALLWPTQSGGVVARALEHVRIAHARDQRRRGLGSDRIDLHQSTCWLALPCKLTDFRVILLDVLVELAKLLLQASQHLARERWQAACSRSQYE